MGESGWDVKKKKCLDTAESGEAAFPLCMRSSRRKQAALLIFPSFFNEKVGVLPYSAAQLTMLGEAHRVVGKTGSRCLQISVFT